MGFNPDRMREAAKALDIDYGPDLSHADLSVGLPSVKLDGAYATCAFPRRRHPEAEERWFIARTEPRREKTVMGFLAGRDVPAFWPTEMVRSKAGRSTQWRSQPMFPSIVFVKLGLVHWFGQRVLATPGVLGFMRLGEGLATVDQPAIDELKRHMIGSLDIRELPTGKKNRTIPFSLEQSVKFNQGPFGGLIATIKAIDPKGRIRVLLDLFGRATKIDVDADEIAAA